MESAEELVECGECDAPRGPCFDVRLPPLGKQRLASIPGGTARPGFDREAQLAGSESNELYRLGGDRAGGSIA